MTINSPAAVIFAMFVAQAEKAGHQSRPARWHAAERHLEGVPGAEGVRVPATAVDAAGARHDRVHRGRDAALALDLDLRLSHPRGGLDRGRGVGVHAGQRVRLRRVGDAGRLAGRLVRAAAVVLLQRPHRLLRGDRQVPRRSADLGALVARPLRRQARAVAAVAVPHPDSRRLTDRAAARGQHRADGDRGVGRRARRHAVAAHQLDGRGDGAADREDRTHRLAHAAGDRPRDQRRPRRRSARWLVVRRAASPTRSNDRPKSCSPISTSSVAARCSRGDQRDRGQLVPGQDRRLRLRPRAAVQHRPPHRRRRQRLHRGQRRRPDPAPADHQRRRGTPTQATRPGPPSARSESLSTPRCAVSRPRPPTRRST